MWRINKIEDCKMSGGYDYYKLTSRPAIERLGLESQPSRKRLFSTERFQIL